MTPFSKCQTFDDPKVTGGNKNVLLILISPTWKPLCSKLQNGTTWHMARVSMHIDMRMLLPKTHFWQPIIRKTVSNLITVGGWSRAGRGAGSHAGGILWISTLVNRHVQKCRTFGEPMLAGGNRNVLLLLRHSDLNYPLHILQSSIVTASEHW